MFKQTWWDDNLPTRFNEFESWVGPSNSITKSYFRKYVKTRGFKSLIDFGCGNATEYDAYKREYPELKYIGVDSSQYLYDLNTKRGIEMIKTDVRNADILDEFVDVVYSRHVLEHQPSYKEALGEIIRIAKKEAVHIFFIPPSNAPEIINYDEKQNLYHNHYNKEDIEEFLFENYKTLKYQWIHFPTEKALIIKK